MGDVPHAYLNPETEGDARRKRHAKACRDHLCQMHCRCWCHGVRHHMNGELRADARPEVNCKLGAKGKR